MPPGRPNCEVDFWIRLDDCSANKVTLRWSLDDWTRDFVLAKTAEDPTVFKCTLYPLKDGSRVEYKFIVWKDHHNKSWVCNETQPIEIVAGGYRNNVLWLADA